MPKLTDSAIVSTGLMALTDDSIRMRWPRKASHRGFAFGMEHVVPRVLLQHVLHRRGSSSSAKDNHASAPVPCPKRHAETVY